MLAPPVRSITVAALGALLLSGCSQALDPEPVGVTSQALCDDGNPCTRDRVLPNGVCLHSPLPGGSSCDDGNACTQDDRCAGGQCRGTPLLCRDGNACTEDRCEPATGCVFPPTAAGAACNDGSACTRGDRCDGRGSCVGTPVDCSDGNDCTTDACHSVLGCLHDVAPSGTACDDGNACTQGDRCSGGVCLGGAALRCNDDNPCTRDRCLPATGCEFAPRPAGLPCSDGSACTTSDRCDGEGACVGSAIACGDGNPCTEDSCDPVAGCVFTASPPTKACDDGNACTTADHCSGSGTCAGGAAVACDDGNGCTSDTCDPGSGCVFSAFASGTSCDDGNACTGSDRCDGEGACAGTAIACDDANPCTVDGCDVGTGCTHAPATAGLLCDDSNACTTSDRCDGAGTCTGAGTVLCVDEDACTIDTCEPSTGCVHTPVSCDDADACTTDSCEPVSGCSHAPVAVEDDDNVCTTDLCVPASGMAHLPTPRGSSCADDDLMDGDELCDGMGHCVAALSSTPVATADDNALERVADGRHPVAASGEAIAVVFAQPVHRDGSAPRLGIAVRSLVGELRGVAWIDEAPMTPHASVAALPDGSFAVVFESLAIDGDGLGIGVARVSAQGLLAGSVQRVNATTAYSQHSPDVSATSEGVVVAWEDESQDGMRRICWRELDSTLGGAAVEHCDGQAEAWDGFVTLATVGARTAMAWQRETDAQGTLEVRIGSSRASLPLSADGGPLPAGEAPALTGLDASTLLLVYASGDGMLVGSVIDELGVELDSVQLAGPEARRAQPALARTLSGAYLAWKQPAQQVDGGWDPQLDELYVQEVRWAAGALEPAESPRSIPRAEANRAGDQSNPGVAPVAVTAGGALAMVWQDLQSHIPGRCPHGDVLVSLEPTPIP